MWSSWGVASSSRVVAVSAVTPCSDDDMEMVDAFLRVAVSSQLVLRKYTLPQAEITSTSRTGSTRTTCNITSATRIPLHLVGFWTTAPATRAKQMPYGRVACGAHVHPIGASKKPACASYKDLSHQVLKVWHSLDTFVAVTPGMCIVKHPMDQHSSLIMDPLPRHGKTLTYATRPRTTHRAVISRWWRRSFAGTFRATDKNHFLLIRSAQRKEQTVPLQNKLRITTISSHGWTHYRGSCPGNLQRAV